MAKGKRTMMYFCQSCGHESAKWMGQCPSCREWNTFVEEEASIESKGMGGAKTVKAKAKKPVPVSFSQVSLSKEDKVKTDIEELDQVLGGGIVPGSLTLVGVTRESENPPCCFRCAGSFRGKDRKYYIFQEKNH